MLSSIRNVKFIKVSKLNRFVLIKQSTNLSI